MNTLKIESPIYLLESSEKCYSCGTIVQVIGLACFKMSERDEEVDEWEKVSELEELILISNISSLPRLILEKIHKIHPLLKKRFSKTANAEYFMNICPECDSHFGDFFLYSKSGGAFSPIDDNEAARIKIHDLKIKGVFKLNATWSMGLGHIIWNKGRRV